MSDLAADLDTLFLSAVKARTKDGGEGGLALMTNIVVFHRRL